MGQERPTRLIWAGARTADGRPIEWYADIPARDLSEAETAMLTEEQMARALKSRLYRAAPVETASAPPAARDKSRTKPGTEE